MRSRSRSAKRSSIAVRRLLTAVSFASSFSRLPRALPASLAAPRELALVAAELVGDQRRAQLHRLALEAGVGLGGLRLALERTQVAARLALDVERTVEVVARALELELGAAAALAVLAEAGGLLDEQAALARLGVDDLLDLALADHGVHLAAEVRLGEHLERRRSAGSGRR